MKTVIMGNVISMAQWKEERNRDKGIATALAAEVEVGQFTADWMDHFEDIRHELSELVEDVERALKERE